MIVFSTSSVYENVSRFFALDNLETNSSIFATNGDISIPCPFNVVTILFIYKSTGELYLFLKESIYS